DEASVRAAPPVLVLEAGQEAADAGQDRDDPVSGARDADQDSRERPDRRRDDASQNDLDRLRTISEQHWLRHPVLSPLPVGNVPNAARAARYRPSLDGPWPISSVSRSSTSRPSPRVPRARRRCATRSIWPAWRTA